MGGIILFIVSEVLFFFSFFWAFFHRSLAPAVDIGASWPPAGIQPFNPFQIPLLNTAILLASGVTVTWAHHGLMENNFTQTTQGLALTILLGIYFTSLQALEYYEAPFCIACSLRFNFLHGYRLPWDPRHCGYNFLGDRSGTSSLITFLSESPFWVRSCGLVLALR